MRNYLTMNLHKKIIYQDALEFIGEVRASISRERFTMKAVRNFEAFLDFLNDAPDAKEFLEQRRIDRSYVTQNIRMILERIYCNPENDFYFTLGLAHNASAEQIHDRWKKLMVMYHPDRNRDDEGYAGMCASKINEAYSVLKDSRKRIEYDRKILQKKTSQVNPLQDLRRERVIRATTREKRHESMSPRLKRTLVNLILPVWLLICTFSLLYMFFENKSYVSSVRSSTSVAEPAKEVVRSSADQEKAESITLRNVELEVQSFLNHFRVAYERGDRDGLFALCASADTESRRMNIERLQKDREQMFKYNKIRYFITNVGFQDAGEMIIVSGEYRIEGSDDNNNDKDVNAIFRGDIRWSLVREDGNLKIAEIEYD